MKKLSISVFAIAAIVFAITSAFTTTKKDTREDYEMWIFNNSSGSQSAYNSAGASADDKYNYVNDFTPSTAENSTSGQTIAQYLDAKFSNPDKICVSATSTELCVVKILQEPNIPNGPLSDGNGQVLAVEFGTLQDVD